VKPTTTEIDVPELVDNRERKSCSEDPNERGEIYFLPSFCVSGKTGDAADTESENPNVVLRSITASLRQRSCALPTILDAVTQWIVRELQYIRGDHLLSVRIMSCLCTAPTHRNLL
jgi:hypothetical protein